jgi:hypothetical protein
VQPVASEAPGKHPEGPLGSSTGYINGRSNGSGHPCNSNGNVPRTAEVQNLRERLAFFESGAFPPLPSLLYSTVTAPARRVAPQPSLASILLAAIPPPMDMGLASMLQRLNEQLQANAQDTAAIRRHLQI